MKLKTLTLAAVTLGLLASLDANAFFKNKQCRREALVDVRGDTFDNNGDGRTTILETAIADPLDNLGVLVDAVLAADPAIADALGDVEARLTVFAPENEAFLAIPPALLDETLADPDLVSSVLLYHVLPGQFDPRRVGYIRKRETLLGQDLFVVRGRTNPSVNNSEVACTGVRTDNGLVWFIDSVLQPQAHQ